MEEECSRRNGRGRTFSAAFSDRGCGVFRMWLFQIMLKFLWHGQNSETKACTRRDRQIRFHGVVQILVRPGNLKPKNVIGETDKLGFQRVFRIWVWRFPNLAFSNVANFLGTSRIWKRWKKSVVAKTDVVVRFHLRFPNLLAAFSKSGCGVFRIWLLLMLMFLFFPARAGAEAGNEGGRM